MKWLLGVALASIISTPVMAAEKRVVFGDGIVGTLETPEQAYAPVVLMLHGFTGTRDELPVAGTDEGVFERTARLLAEAGVASFRIDFRGSGDSAGAWEDTTFSSQVLDALAALDWLDTAEEINGKRVALLGWSQGGLVAAHVAAASPRVKSVTLWAPVVHPLHTYEAILGADTLAEALSAEPLDKITATLPWEVDTTLNAAFYQEFATTSTAAAVAGYAGPLQVIVGSQDTVVAPQPASGEVLMRYHEGPEELRVVKADHVWNAFTGPRTLDTEMVPLTLNWLAEHL